MKAVFQDRLGTNRASGARFRPYGDEITSTTNDRQKFGTYNRDGFSGLDYADQRYYSANTGRFNTADPYQASAGPVDPSSWNRYSYTGGDPINRNDPSGLYWCYVLSRGNEVLASWCDSQPMSTGGGNPRDCMLFSPLGGPVMAAGCIDEPPPPQPAAAQVSATNIRRDGVQQSEIMRRMTSLADNIDEECAAWLVGSQASYGSFRAFQSAMFDDARMGSGVAVGHAAISATGHNVINGVANLPNNLGLAIIINTLGAFFRKDVSTDNGKIPGGTELAGVFILLHEYAHVFHSEGFLDDLDTPGNGVANNNKIEAKCGKTLDRFR